MSMLLYFDAAGDVIGTLDFAGQIDLETGEMVGLIDFDAVEEAGLLAELPQVSTAAGLGIWPEYLGGQAHQFKVERAGGRIRALVHRESGHRRERDAVAETGRPDRPLRLDEQGRTAAPGPRRRPNLPLVGQRATDDE